MRKLSFIIIAVVMILTSCSLFPEKTYSYIWIQSPCWTDDTHFIVYVAKRKVFTVSDFVSTSEPTEWVAGELWEVDVLTGESVQLCSNKGDMYYQASGEVNLSKNDTGLLLYLKENTYLIDNDYSKNWKVFEDIKNVTWIDAQHFVGKKISEDKIIEVDIISGEKNVIDIPYFEKTSTSHLAYNSSNDAYAIWNEDELILKKGIVEKHIFDKDSIRVGNESVVLEWINKVYANDLKEFIVLANIRIDSIACDEYLIYNDSLQCYQIYNFNNTWIIPDRRKKYMMVENQSSELIYDVYDWDKNYVSTITLEEIVKDEN